MKTEISTSTARLISSEVGIKLTAGRTNQVVAVRFHSLTHSLIHCQFGYWLIRGSVVSSDWQFCTLFSFNQLLPCSLSSTVSWISGSISCDASPTVCQHLCTTFDRPVVINGICLDIVTLILKINEWLWKMAAEWRWQARKVSDEFLGNYPSLDTCL
jgi:hypothetical protein